MICTAKRIQYTGQEFREGRLDYEMRLDLIGTELYGKTVGIVGLGHIGRTLAQKCKLGFDMRVLAYDPYIKRPVSNGLEVELVDELSELLKESDFVCLTAILTEETRGIIGAKELKQMKSSAHLVNITPELVNEGALIEALQNATIAGAGLDAFDPDPPNDPQNPLFKMSNVAVTPHMAGVTKENQRRIALDNAEQIIAFLQGQTPENVYWP
jgi:phosphoglycerate dehydrogenase-like enzyme